MEFFNTGSDVDTTLQRMTADFAEVYSVLYGSPMFMTTDARNRVRALTIRVGEDWMRMREYGRVNSILVFKVTPKVHKYQHLYLYCCLLNPRHIMTYSEESAMGTDAKVWRSAMRGQYGASAQSMVLAKRVVGLRLRLEE